MKKSVMNSDKKTKWQKFASWVFELDDKFFIERIKNNVNTLF